MILFIILTPAYKMCLFDTQHRHTHKPTPRKLSFETIQQPECFKWKTILKFHIFVLTGICFSCSSARTLCIFVQGYLSIDFDVCCSSNLSLRLFAWCSRIFYTSLPFIQIKRFIIVKKVVLYRRWSIWGRIHFQSCTMYHMREWTNCIPLHWML